MSVFKKVSGNLSIRFQKKGYDNSKFGDVFFLDRDRDRTYIFETKNKLAKPRHPFEDKHLLSVMD